MAHRSAWDRLAEALGIQTEINWDAVNKRRQMQQYGTMDRRDKQGPMPYFKPAGMQQRTQAPPPAPPNRGQQPAAMSQVPFGNDRPGQTNPLFSPPKPRSPLSTAPNSPQALSGGDEDEDEDTQY